MTVFEVTMDVFYDDFGGNGMSRIGNTKLFANKEKAREYAKEIAEKALPNTSEWIKKHIGSWEPDSYVVGNPGCEGFQVLVTEVEVIE